MERAFVDGCGLPRQMKREARHFNGDVVHHEETYLDINKLHNVLMHDTQFVIIIIYFLSIFQSLF